MSVLLVCLLIADHKFMYLCPQICKHVLFLFFSLIDIHYFHCLRIVEILKGTEASSKNIFGRYSSQRMKVRRFKQTLSHCQFLISISSKVLLGDFCVLCSSTKKKKKLRFELCFLFCLSQDWQEIVSLYEADNVYLGECTLKRKETYTYQHFFFFFIV